MGHVKNADGSLTINPTPSTVGDLQAIADLAMELGGLLKGTSTQRLQLTGSQVRPGWLFSETDTGALYQRLPSAWRMVARPPIFFKLARATAPFDFTNAWTDMLWDAPVAEGTLAGFTTTDNTTFTCTIPGLYDVRASILARGGSSVSTLQVQVRKNGSAVYFKLDQSSGVDGVWKSLECGGPIPFLAGDTLKVSRLAGTTIAGIPSVFTSCAVNYLHP